jgi:hypothetical protein
MQTIDAEIYQFLADAAAGPEFLLKAEMWTDRTANCCGTKSSVNSNEQCLVQIR